MYFAVLMLIAALFQPVFAQQNNRQILEDIRNAYEGLDFAVAEARITAALAEYEQFTPTELSEIHVIYALIYFARNELPAVESHLAQALQLNPSLTLDTLETPPQVLDLFSSIKQQENDPVATTPAEIRYLIVQDPRPAAVMRSMLVPGWGQLYKEERKKGWLLVGLWGATAGGTLIAHANRSRTEKRYLASETQAQAASRYRPFDTWHKIRNNLFMAAAGIWVYSYIDALLPSQPATSAFSPSKHSINAAAGPSGFSVCWHF